MSYIRTILFEHVVGDGSPVAIAVVARPSQDSRLALEFASSHDESQLVYLEPDGSVELAGALTAGLQHEVDLQLRVVDSGWRECTLVVCTDPNRYASYTPFNADHHQALIAVHTDRLIHPGVCTVSEVVELHNAVADGHNYLNP